MLVLIKIDMIINIFFFIILINFLKTAKNLFKATNLQKKEEKIYIPHSNNNLI